MLCKKQVFAEIVTYMYMVIHEYDDTLKFNVHLQWILLKIIFELRFKIAAMTTFYF